MVTRTHTISLLGLSPTRIDVEIETTRGQPQLLIIGLPGKAIAEAKERVSAALGSCGVRIRPKKTIVNLAPADLRKTGSSYDLPIAVGLLKNYGLLGETSRSTAYFGEFSLTGELKPVRGALALALGAVHLGFDELVFPAQHHAELALIDTIKLRPIKHLCELLGAEASGAAALSSGKPSAKSQRLEHTQPTAKKQQQSQFSPQSLSQPSPQSAGAAGAASALDTIAGQALAKRALEIVAAGNHNLLLIGPPGSGKTTLARAVVELLPKLNKNELISVAQLHSLTSARWDMSQLQRPFRSPHHSSSISSILGGGQTLFPGELSLAHNGVLFLDELAEFPRNVLEALRQPLDSKTIQIKRSAGSVEYPCNCSVIAATNACACGNYLSNNLCSCTQHQRAQYQHKLSGPLKDRFDLQLIVKPVSTSALLDAANTAGDNKRRIDATRTNASQINVVRKRILAARELQLARYQSLTTNSLHWTNATCPHELFTQALKLDVAARALLETATHKLRLTPRGIYKILRIAQTITDLSTGDLPTGDLSTGDLPKPIPIAAAAIAEGLQFRLAE